MEFGEGEAARINLVQSVNINLVTQDTFMSLAYVHDMPHGKHVFHRRTNCTGVIRPSDDELRRRMGASIANGLFLGHCPSDADEEGRERESASVQNKCAKLASVSPSSLLVLQKVIHSSRLSGVPGTALQASANFRKFCAHIVQL